MNLKILWKRKFGHSTRDDNFQSLVCSSQNVSHMYKDSFTYTCMKSNGPVIHPRAPIINFRTQWGKINISWPCSREHSSERSSHESKTKRMKEGKKGKRSRGQLIILNQSSAFFLRVKYNGSHEWHRAQASWFTRHSRQSCALSLFLYISFSFLLVLITSEIENVPFSHVHSHVYHKM